MPLGDERPGCDSSVYEGASTHLSVRRRASINLYPYGAHRSRHNAAALNRPPMTRLLRPVNRVRQGGLQLPGAAPNLNGQLVAAADRAPLSSVIASPNSRAIRTMTKGAFIADCHSGQVC